MRIERRRRRRRRVLKRTQEHTDSSGWKEGSGENILF